MHIMFRYQQVEDVVMGFTHELTSRQIQHGCYVDVLKSFTGDGLMCKMLSSFCKIFVRI